MACFTCVWWNWPVWWWSPDKKACTWPPPSPAWSNSHGRSQEETGAQVVATNRGAPQVSRALSDLHFQPLWPTSQSTMPPTPHKLHPIKRIYPLLLQKTFETHNIRLANEKSVTNQPAHIIALHDIQIDIFYKKTQRQAFPAGWPSNDVFPSMAVIYKSATNQ